MTCPTDVGQIQKLIFWRRGNEIADVATMILAATWTSLKAATDSTKAVVSPFIDAPVFEVGDFVEEGSGNEVRDGIPHIMGSGNTKFTCKVYSPSSAVMREFKDLMCESLDVILVNENGFFVHHLDSASDVQGFPIYNLGVKDRYIGGFQASDYFDVVFYLRPNWADNLTITDPTANFSALDL
jgi:hypothetical protein